MARCWRWGLVLFVGLFPALTEIWRLWPGIYTTMGIMDLWWVYITLYIIIPGRSWTSISTKKKYHESKTSRFNNVGTFHKKVVAFQNYTILDMDSCKAYYFFKLRSSCAKLRSSCAKLRSSCAKLRSSCAKLRSSCVMFFCSFVFEVTTKTIRFKKTIHTKISILKKSERYAGICAFSWMDVQVVIVWYDMTWYDMTLYVTGYWLFSVFFFFSKSIKFYNTGFGVRVFRSLKKQGCKSKGHQGGVKAGQTIQRDEWTWISMGDAENKKDHES